MAMGLAVVGTEAGGIPEAIIHGETGVLVPPADGKALAAAIVRLLKDDADRARMGQAGLKRVAAEFGVAKLLQGTVGAYERAIRAVHGATANAHSS
jgi:glycosyltransferase involved in cell wall biosynthesis